MSRWKVLAATPFLLIPLAFASVSVGDGIEHRDTRPAVVLPSLVEGPQVTLRPAAPDSGPDEGDPDGAGPDGSGRGKPDPGRTDPPRGEELRCSQDDDDDDDRDDDRDDDEVEVVQPCPDAVGDDDDDEGDDDGDDADGDD